MKQKIPSILIFLVWLVVALLLIQKHSPWRDEFQSWLIATRTESTSEFFEAVRFERHPPLHYLLQKAVLPNSFFQEFTPQIQTQIVTLPFVFGIALMLAFYFSIPPAFLAAILFGHYFLREYTLISRCYPIGVFFILLSLIFRDRKWKIFEAICLALAAQVHLLFTLAVGVIAATDIYRRVLRLRNLKDSQKDSLLQVLLMMAVLFALYLQRPPADSGFPTAPSFGWNNIEMISYYFVQALMGLENSFREFQWNAYPYSQDSVWLLAPLFAWWISLSVGWLEIPVLALPVFVLALSYSASQRHLGVVFFLFVYLWLKNKKDWSFKKPVGAFAIASLLSSCMWIYQWAPWQTRPNFDFSDSRAAIEGSKAAGIDLSSMDTKIFANDEAPYFTVAAEANTQIFSVVRMKWMKYPRFTLSDLKSNLEIFCREKLWESQTMQGQVAVLGMTSAGALPAGCEGAKLIYSTTRKIITDEKYFIYKLN